MKSTEFDRQYVRVALNHLLLGNLDSQALEDKIFHFTAALDALVEKFGFSTKNLLYGLGEEDRMQVKTILRSSCEPDPRSCQEAGGN
jgi:hypothetical protein